MSGPPPGATGPPGSHSSSGLPPPSDSLGSDPASRDYWRAVQSDPASTIFYMALGLVFTSMVTGAVMAHMIRYYSHFKRDPSPLRMVATSLGSLIVMAVFVIEGIQVKNLARHAFSGYLDILTLNHTLNTTTFILNLVLTLGAFSYFSWQAFELCGRRVLLLHVLAMLILGRYAYAVFVLVKSFAWNPKEEPGPLPGDIQTHLRICAVLDVIHNLFLCALLVFLFVRSKTSVFNVNKSGFVRFTSIVYGSMLPAVLSTIVSEVATLSYPSVSIDHNGWIKVFQNLTGPLGFLCVLWTVNAQKTQRQSLDSGVKSVGRSTYTNTSSNSATKSAGAHVDVKSPSTIESPGPYLPYNYMGHPDCGGGDQVPVASPTVPRVRSGLNRVPVPQFDEVRLPEEMRDVQGFDLNSRQSLHRSGSMTSGSLINSDIEMDQFEQHLYEDQGWDNHPYARRA